MTRTGKTEMGRAETGHKDTADRILDVAERLVQMHGFNGFSYADIADEIHIRKASLHYHFPTKAALGEALITRYRTTFLDALAAIDRRNDDAAAKLRRYSQLYTKVLRKQRMCLCGMLAAEFETLPKPMRNGVIEFFSANEVWLRRVLDDGRREKTLRFEGAPAAIASFLVSSLEGAMLVARSYGKMSRFDAIVSKLLNDLAR